MLLIIYLIAFLEWFTTLSVEIVAIRQSAPVIGINSISTSIILWVILLALSYGYYRWWILSINKEKIKNKLLLNFSLASLYYFFISFFFSKILLENLLYLSSSYFFSILLASILLFFIPVFLASQTIPLLSELLKWSNSWEKIWKLLFYSTIWSFVWSVWTSSLFFPIIWVFKTWLLSALILWFCAFILSLFFIKKEIYIFLSGFLFLFFLYFIVNFQMSNNTIFSFANAHHNISIYDTETKRIFSIDWWYSSGINLNDKKSFFSYIKEVESEVDRLKAKNILVIWAAWFTFPNDISKFSFVENIDVVDIDSSLKEISEKYFLEEKLSDKINFYPTTSRYFLNQINYKKYDFILVDAYSGKSPPSQVLTYEFFKKLNQIWDNIYLNIILDRDIDSNFSKNLLTSINKAFSKSYYKDVNSWFSYLTNILVSNNDIDTYKENKYNQDYIYRDDKNSIELDLFEMHKNNYLFNKNRWI